MCFLDYIFARNFLFCFISPIPFTETLLEITCTLTSIPLFLSLSETSFHNSYSSMLQTKPLSPHSKFSFATWLFPQITYHLIAYHRHFLVIFLYWFPQPLEWKLYVARFSLFYFLTFLATCTYKSSRNAYCHAWNPFIGPHYLCNTVPTPFFGYKFLHMRS